MRINNTEQDSSIQDSTTQNSSNQDSATQNLSNQDSTTQNSSTQAFYQNNEEYLADILYLAKLKLYSFYKGQYAYDKTARSDYQTADTAPLEREIVGLFDSCFHRVGINLDSEETQDLLDIQLRIAENAAKSAKRGMFLPFERILSVFQPSDFEFHCLCLTLAGELDKRFERIYGILQGDLLSTNPCVDFLTRTYANDECQYLALLSGFANPDPAMSYIFELTSSPAVLLSSQEVRLNRRILRYLLGDTAPDAKFCRQLGVQYHSMLTDLPKLLLDQDVQIKLKRLCHPDATPGSKTGSSMSCSDSTPASESASDSMPVPASASESNSDPTPASASASYIHLHGPRGSGKKLHVKLFSQFCQKGSLFLDLSRLKQVTDENGMDIFTAIFREVTLQQCTVCLTNAEELLRPGTGEHAESAEKWLLALLDSLKNITAYIFLTSETHLKLSGLFPEIHFLTIPLIPLSGTQRVLLWNKLAADHNLSKKIDLTSVAEKFTFTIGVIENALIDAKNHAELENSGKMTDRILLDACRKQLVHELEKHAQHVPAVFGWDDLILPSEQKGLLRQAVDRVRYRSVVLEKWGFEQKLPYGKSLTMIFKGPPGTGKTMAAQVLAMELGLDLFKVDQSCIVSKYIGETEQNLRIVFDEAQKSHCILFFDEADALFGKRTEVRDSHDRNANMEVSFLLQKLEDYDGIVILSTNFIQNVDEAFKRRIKLIINFPMPDAANRLKLWTSMVPKETPIDDVDFEFFAQQFELSGSTIKNVLLSAAYMAAAAAQPLSMKHLVVALSQEQKKLGRVIINNDFGDYAYLLTHNS